MSGKLIRNLRSLKRDPPVGITAAPEEDNIMLWNAVINGPEDTPWSGGKFKLTLDFPHDYPMKPPRVRFVSQMFHPNIYEDGRVCVDFLEDEWTPALLVETILISIQSLLSDANPDTPVNSDAARMFVDNRREYNRRVREIAEQSRMAQ
ncbi:hypothetical protein ABFS82_04G160900 [Erythranthe guttata]|uniref:UBC core domain-containing protein n=1 Tax=Erythranthe guttata TaxID=4155 RepID=A0A022QD37_ERYGU|nr:PREDICTED: ubiquitin-conjugating enzyme E2 2-like [Erythranthe guttata]EYU24410.1 hypothetical protein MIMGU_mgv1a015728mg [Erythranthe guttata]EYU24411.1 hypothetical protein MIMGU_mgv1a015728mg [Erythranthe guttata]|eukprot:XP_012852972.1 PREDICTED: ubiquitin-conjugating enzyme E2 2-like [Erythranthe guttata]